MADCLDLANELAKFDKLLQVEKFFEDNQSYNDWIFVELFALLDEEDFHAAYT